MTLYYAIGGGFGHRTRAQRVLGALEINDAEVLSSDDVPSRLEGRPGDHREWLVQRLRGRRVIVDAFPAGIQGELSGIEGVTFDHVARLMKWEAYRNAVTQKPPHFETTYVVEPLSKSHEEFVRSNSNQVVTLTLSPGADVRRIAPASRPFAIVVHSGPASEVEELIGYARELGPEPLVVATPCEMNLPSGCERVETDRPFDYFEAAVRIVSGAGFNVMTETEPWRDKHWPLPFPRRFDDQYARAARRRKRADASSAVQALTAPSASSSAQRA